MTNTRARVTNAKTGGPHGPGRWEHGEWAIGDTYNIPYKIRKRRLISQSQSHAVKVIGHSEHTGKYKTEDNTGFRYFYRDDELSNSKYQKEQLEKGIYVNGDSKY